MFSGNNYIAFQLLHNITPIMDNGIAANGSQPHELIRTQPFHYPMFTPAGFTRLVLQGGRKRVSTSGGTAALRGKASRKQSSSSSRWHSRALTNDPTKR